eukprot:GHRQ01026509.1.p1 GENE.GHRQ01026509.1~~GHRQ01026509.1.p1  ORF type:complete len:108 (-),score=42.56 GHRQ01026509.1:481-783(-)
MVTQNLSGMVTQETCCCRCCCAIHSLQGFALALKLGTTKQQVDSLIGIHPTSAEEVLGLKGPTRSYRDGKQQDGKQEEAAGKGQGKGKAEESPVKASHAG